MTGHIAQGSAIRIGLQAYLSADHVTPATGKTIAITISRNGAAYGNPNAGATNATEIGSGSYYVDLDATDTGTAGPLFVRGAVSGIDDVVALFQVGLVAADVVSWKGSAAPAMTGDAYAALTSAITESYANNGAAPSVHQALLAIHQMLMHFAISGTALTVKKLNGADTAFTATLDDATNPTGVSRS